MELRGERRCTECGTHWSYFETGTIQCPECESVRSVGVEDRQLHTGGEATLDLTDVVADVDDAQVQDLADRAGEVARAYLRETGFVTAGVLRPLSDTYLLADELVVLGRTLARAIRIEDAEARYFLDLLRAGAAAQDPDAECERPTPAQVPSSLRAERGLAVARSVRDYQRDLRAVLEEPGGELARTLSALTTQRKRIEALDGDVDPAEAEVLVTSTRELSAYLLEDDETALARASERLASGVE